MPDLKQELAALRLDREPVKRRGRRWVVWTALLVVLAAAGVAGWQWAARARPIVVDTVEVSGRSDGGQSAVLNASGYVTARRRATVSSKITGKVVEVNVEEGIIVREGQVLARLDDSTAKAAVGLAEAQADAARRNVRESEVRLAEAKLTLDRLTSLAKKGLATTADADAARAAVESLDARITAAREQVKVTEQQIALERTNLENTIIRAPFTGVAISKDAQPGEMVSPVSAGGSFTRTGICTIVDMRSLEIEVDVNESYINRVKADQDVTAVLNAYSDWQIPARVITIVPTADRQKATVLVRIGFKELDERILPDMGVKVTFLGEAVQNQPSARPVTLVPKSAIRIEGDREYAFVVRDGLVDRRAVTTGGSDGDRVEVLAGLNAGELVVVSPPPTLVSGAMVTVESPRL